MIDFIVGGADCIGAPVACLMAYGLISVLFKKASRRCAKTEHAIRPFPINRDTFGVTSCIWRATTSSTRALHALPGSR
jgi:hypothetical protein